MLQGCGSCLEDARPTLTIFLHQDETQAQLTCIHEGEKFILGILRCEVKEVSQGIQNCVKFALTLKGPYKLCILYNSEWILVVL